MKRHDDEIIIEEIRAHMKFGQEHNIAPFAYTALLILEELRRIRELLEVERLTR